MFNVLLMIVNVLSVLLAQHVLDIMLLRKDHLFKHRSLLGVNVTQLCNAQLTLLLTLKQVDYVQAVVTGKASNLDA